MWRRLRDLSGSEKGFIESDLSDIFDVLKSRGGLCDCEVLYNAVETSRLKRNYWRKRADEGQSSVSHQGGDE